MTSIEEKVLLLLKEGDKRYSEIVRATGHADKVVWESVLKLRSRKYVESKKRGTYRLTQRGAALVQGVPYAIYKLQLEVRVAKSCFWEHIGYLEEDTSYLPRPTPYAIDSVSISSVARAIEDLLDEIVDNLRIEVIDLPRTWTCEGLAFKGTLDDYLAHRAQHLANIRRLSAELRDQSPELSRASEVIGSLLKEAESSLGRLKEGWKKRAFDKMIVG